MNLVYAGYMSTLDCVFLTYSRFFNHISLQRTAKFFIRGECYIILHPCGDSRTLCLKHYMPDALYD